MCLVFVFLTIALGSSYGEQRAESIYEGEISYKGQFPFLVRLYRYEKGVFPICTGSVVADNYVLTAGHCCKVPGKLLVVTGELNHERFINEVNKTSNFSVLGYYPYLVSRKHLHPGFKKEKVTILHDVCILQLEQPMNSDKDGHTVAPVAYRGFFTQMCSVMGWGQTENNVHQSKLYYKEVFAEVHRRKNLLIRLYYHSICKGDSGGPLFCHGKIYGVASYSTTEICSVPGIDYYSFLQEESDFLRQFVSLASTLHSTYFSSFFIFLIHYRAVLSLLRSACLRNVRSIQAL